MNHIMQLYVVDVQLHMILILVLHTLHLTSCLQHLSLAKQVNSILKRGWVSPRFRLVD
jgi:hypothetical protein